MRSAECKMQSAKLKCRCPGRMHRVGSALADVVRKSRDPRPLKRTLRNAKVARASRPWAGGTPASVGRTRPTQARAQPFFNPRFIRVHGRLNCFGRTGSARMIHFSAPAVANKSRSIADCGCHKLAHMKSIHITIAALIALISLGASWCAAAEAPATNIQHSNPTTAPTTRSASVSELIQQLQHGDLGQRQKAASMLGDLEEQAAPATDALIAALSDPDERLRAEAINALASIGPKAKAAVPHA